MIRVLVVDDSPTARAALRRLLETDGDIRVVGEAANGTAALRALRSAKPDLVSMDVMLGAEDGIELTRRIMATHATPILLVTSAASRDPSLAFRALAAGALDVCEKPGARGVDD